MVIENPIRLAKELCPKVWQQKDIASFTRQMNVSSFPQLLFQYPCLTYRIYDLFRSGGGSDWTTANPDGVLSRLVLRDGGTRLSLVLQLRRTLPLLTATSSLGQPLALGLLPSLQGYSRIRWTSLGPISPLRRRRRRQRLFPPPYSPFVPFPPLSRVLDQFPVICILGPARCPLLLLLPHQLLRWSSLLVLVLWVPHHSQRLRLCLPTSSRRQLRRRRCSSGVPHILVQIPYPRYRSCKHLGRLCPRRRPPYWQLEAPRNFGSHIVRIAKFQMSTTTTDISLIFTNCVLKLGSLRRRWRGVFGVSMNGFEFGFGWLFEQDFGCKRYANRSSFQL